MTAKLTFGNTLSRIRHELGFPTAHAFYRHVRGRRTLGLAYVNYLRLEKGRNLPRPDRLRRILAALNLDRGSGPAQELVKAYLASLLGSEDLLEFVTTGGAAADPLEWRPAEDAARLAEARRVVRLTVDQYRLLTERPDCWRCHILLSNTAGWLEVADVARQVGLEVKATAAAVKRLADAGLLESSRGRARSPFSRKILAIPAALPLEERRRGVALRDSWLTRNEEPVRISALALRMTRAQYDRYQRHLLDIIRLAGIYGDSMKTEDSDVYLVEGRVYRIFD